MKKPQQPFTVVILRKHANVAPAEQLFPSPAPRQPPKRDPLAVATEFVPGFDRETMTLRGQAVSLNAIMRLTNRTLKSEGKPQLSVNPNWVVP